MSDTKLILETVKSIERAFGALERRFNSFELEFKSLDSKFATKNDLKVLEDRLFSRIDVAMKVFSEKEEERTMIRIRVDRHDADIMRLKKKVGIK